VIRCHVDEFVEDALESGKKEEVCKNINTFTQSENSLEEIHFRHLAVNFWLDRRHI